MFRPLARVASGLVIAPFLLFGSTWAPQHVHEPASGESHALIHSHFEPHHLETHEPEGAEFESSAERVIWIESAILHQTAYHADSGPSAIVISFDPIADVSAWSATPSHDGAPTHGPPRRHPSFRGPPLSPA